MRNKSDINVLYLQQPVLRKVFLGEAPHVEHLHGSRHLRVIALVHAAEATNSKPRQKAKAVCIAVSDLSQGGVFDERRFSQVTFH